MKKRHKRIIFIVCSLAALGLTATAGTQRT